MRASCTIPMPPGHLKVIGRLVQGTTVVSQGQPRPLPSSSPSHRPMQECRPPPSCPLGCQTYRGSGEAQDAVGLGSVQGDALLLGSTVSYRWLPTQLVCAHRGRAMWRGNGSGPAPVSKHQACRYLTPQIRAPVFLLQTEKVAGTRP